MSTWALPFFGHLLSGITSWLYIYVYMWEHEEIPTHAADNIYFMWEFSIKYDQSISPPSSEYFTSFHVASRSSVYGEVWMWRKYLYYLREELKRGTFGSMVRVFGFWGIKIALGINKQNLKNLYWGLLRVIWGDWSEEHFLLWSSSASWGFLYLFSKTVLESIPYAPSGLLRECPSLIWKLPYAYCFITEYEQ